MKKEELYKFAIKGIEAEIDKIEKSINKGIKLLNNQDGNEQEILKKIQAKKEEIEVLKKKMFDLDWEMAIKKERG